MACLYSYVSMMFINTFSLLKHGHSLHTYTTALLTNRATTELPNALNSITPEGQNEHGRRVRPRALPWESSNLNLIALLTFIQRKGPWIPCSVITLLEIKSSILTALAKLRHISWNFNEGIKKYLITINKKFKNSVGWLKFSVIQPFIIAT